MQGQSSRVDFPSNAATAIKMSRRGRRSTNDIRVSATRPLEEPLFRRVLLRDRLQADRFDTTFGLVLVIPSGSRRVVGHSAAVFAALAATGQDTDVYGWFEQGVVAGAIRWHRAGVGTAPLQEYVERELERRLGAEAKGYSVRSYVYAPSAESMPAPFREAVIDHAGRSALHRWFKRGLDIVGSAALLLASAPALLTIAAIVKATSKGPVFFRQQRIGLHGKPFTMLKFRTMHANAGHDIHQQFVSQFIQGGVKDDTGGSGFVFKLVADPRITKVGNFLRRSSLDELPQFWNVLRGEMSLVGPRPPLPYEVKVYKRWHWRRVLEAKPGITGLWQVTGRSRTTFDDMVRLDLRYAKAHSIWVDLKILLDTPRAVITGNGAR